MTESEQLIITKIDNVHEDVRQQGLVVARLDSNVTTLVGLDGNGGSFGELRGKVEEHEASKNRAHGAMWLAGALGGTGFLLSILAHGKELLAKIAR